MPNAVSGTLTPNVATANLMVNEGPGGINVVNRSGSGTIWVSLTSTPPTVGGNDCFPVLGARRFTPDEILSQVRLISDAALAYTVERA